MWLDAPLDRSAHAPGPPHICPASGYRHLTLSHRRQRARQATTASNSQPQPASQPAAQGYRMHKHAEHIVKSSVLGIKYYARSDQIYTHQLGTKLHSRCRQCVWFTFFFLQLLCRELLASGPYVSTARSSKPTQPLHHRWSMTPRIDYLAQDKGPCQQGVYTSCA